MSVCIEGPISATYYMTNPHTKDQRQHFFVFGDEHTPFSENQCKTKPVIDINEFISKLFQLVPPDSCIDVFIEEHSEEYAYLSEGVEEQESSPYWLFASKEDRRHEDNTLFDVQNLVFPLTHQCRIHWSDIRHLSQEEDDDLSLPISIYRALLDITRPILIRIFWNRLKNPITVPTYHALLDMLLGLKPLDPDMLGDLHVSMEEMHRLLRSAPFNIPLVHTITAWHSALSKRLEKCTLTKDQKEAFVAVCHHILDHEGVEPPDNQFAHESLTAYRYLDNLVTLLLDMYTFLRLFTRFRDDHATETTPSRNTCRSAPQPKVSIIYIGDLHAEHLGQMFKACFRTPEEMLVVPGTSTPDVKAVDFFTPTYLLERSIEVTGE